MFIALLIKFPQKNGLLFSNPFDYKLIFILQKHGESLLHHSNVLL